MYAVIGTLISTFIVGFLTFWLGQIGAIPIDRSNPMEALIFGSLISAVDPVATLSIIGYEGSIRCRGLRVGAWVGIKGPLPCGPLTP